MGSQLGGGSINVRAPELSTRGALGDVLTGLEGLSGSLAEALSGVTEANPALVEALAAQGQGVSQLGELASSALAGFQDLGQSGLPSDLERQVLASVRSTQGARGAIRNPGSALQEASRLGLASEQVRANRLSQAQGALGAFFGASHGAAQTNLGVLGTVLPDANALLGIPLQQSAQGLQARIQTTLNRNQRFGDILDASGQAAQAGASA